MTVAICTNCGELKHGAWYTCPACDCEAFDSEISILLSDHNLYEKELPQIGDAIRVIHDTGLDAEMRLHLLMYFLSRKWPKLLEYNINFVKPEFQKKLDALYLSKLSHLKGQEDPALKVSLIKERTWTRAHVMQFQTEDDAWQNEVKGILLNSMGIAKKVVILKIRAGEGAILQRLTHIIGKTIHGCDYRRLAANATELIGDTKEYRRTVNEFCSRVRNGWSDRTQEQAAYFRGLCQRLEEMAEYSRAIIEHKAGINRLIDIDFKRARQEFSQSYNMFIKLSYVVLDPTRINPDGTRKSG